jgi:hypothetical protein
MIQIIIADHGDTNAQGAVIATNPPSKPLQGQGDVEALVAEPHHQQRGKRSRRAGQPC